MCSYAQCIFADADSAVRRVRFSQEHYLYSSFGREPTTQKSTDFLAVLDADSTSPRYGQACVYASVIVPGPSGTPHHTELEMPEDGFLLANACESRRTMVS